MGYDTKFDGKFVIQPEPLSEGLNNYINKLSETRRMNRRIEGFGTEGEFFVFGSGFAGQDADNTIIKYNEPPSTQPSLWCQWIISNDGQYLGWDGGEKFYDYTKWLEYIINNFLAPFDYWLEGSVEWQGEEVGDLGLIDASKEKVIIKEYSINGEFINETDSFIPTPRYDFKDIIETNSEIRRIIEEFRKE
jgi:hypothetical protein